VLAATLSIGKPMGGSYTEWPHGRPATRIARRAELAAQEAVVRALRNLGQLDGAQAYLGLTEFRQSLEAELERPIRGSSGLATRNR